MQTSLSTDLPTFHLNEQGFPFPGEVIRYYRERMTYTDSTGKQRHWTQADLAKRLNVSEITVRLMETQNKYLTLIERRQTIAALLKIPPALLGLASLDDFQRILQQHHAEDTSITSAKNAVSASEIQFYRDALPAFKNAYEQGVLLPQTMESWITCMNNTIKQIHAKPKNDTLAILAHYHIITANIYSSDLQNWVKSIEHLDMAKHIANTLNYHELLAVAHHYAGEMYLNQGNNLLARAELDFALSLSKSASPQVKGSILTYVALSHALTGTDEADRLYVRKLLDESEKYATRNIDSNMLMKFDNTQRLANSADTLIALKRYEAALDRIYDAEEFSSTRKRWIEYLKILRAECYIKQRKAEYEQAIELLTQILENNKNIQYYVDYVARLHKLIVASSYGNAPDVADLEMMLRKLRVKQ